MNSPISQNYFVAGASRGVGFEVVKRLRQQNHTVVAFIRTPDTRTQLEVLGAQVQVGDALDPETVAAALQCFGPTPVSVVTTIGGKGSTRDEPRSDYLGNRNLIEAAKSIYCQRFLLVSSIGVGNSEIALPPPVLETLGPALLAKAKAEEHLIASDLSYTIIRPGGLLSEQPTGKGLLTENPQVAGSITRIDVADLVVQSLQSAAAANRILAAVDRDRIRSEQPVEGYVL